MALSPSKKAMLAMANDPATQLAKALANNPATQLAKAMANDPATQLAKAMANDPATQLAKAMANDPATQLAKALANNPAIKAMERLANNPAIKAMERLANNPAIIAAQALANNPVIKAMESLANNPMMQSIERIMAEHQKIIKGLSGTVRLGGLAEITGRMQFEPVVAVAVAAKVDALQAAIDEIDSADDYDQIGIEKQFVELIDGLFDPIGQAVEKIEIRSFAAFICLLISILLALYLYQQSSIQIENMREELHQDHNEITDRISQHENESGERDLLILDGIKKLEEKIEKLSEAKNAFEGTFYVVIRPVPLNVEQQYQGAYSSWLLTGQEVELIERSGKWIRVIAYDFETGTTQIGWVMKKYLRRIH